MLKEVLSSVANHSAIQFTRSYVPSASARQFLINQYQNYQMRKIVHYMVASDAGVANAQRIFKKFLVERNLDQSVKFKIEKVNYIQPDASGKISLIKYACHPKMDSRLRGNDTTRCHPLA